MVYRTLTISILLALIQISVSRAQADVVNFVVDSTQSFADVTVNGVGPETSQTSGTGVLNLTPSTPPFGVAQITDLDIILDDGLNFALGAGVTASTTAGGVMINLTTPGAAGTVTSGEFDQTGNLLEFSGDVDVLDPFNILGGDTTVDLSTLTPGLVDFNGVTLSRAGDIVTISGTYDITRILDVNGNSVTFDIAGVFVASGLVTVPEPGAMMVLVASFGLVVMRRRRSK